MISDGIVEDANFQNEQEKGHSKKELETKVIILCVIWYINYQKVQSNGNLLMQISPLSTLEPSFEALNAKKFDGDC